MRPLLLIVFATALVFAAPVRGQTDRDRAVHIIEDAPPVGPPAAAAPAQPAPLTPLPPLPKSLSSADNSAGLVLELLPAAQVSIGSILSFRITTQQPGYLILVDIDSSGKLTQIYPNNLSLRAPQEQETNFLKGGVTKTIPEPHSSANFQFVTSPPLGVGMVIAILSDKPVQMLDLPDVPSAIAGQAAALDYVRDTTRTLKILPSDENGTIQEAKWSFATQIYAIR
jgi:Domain of unknown function (DUF4384)